MIAVFIIGGILVVGAIIAGMVLLHRKKQEPVAPNPPEQTPAESPKPAPKPRTRLFNAPSCDRCVHRFGTTSNREWCTKHVGNEKCYRFKLDTKIC